MRNMEFAFNDKDFSDRVLHIEIVTESLNSKSDLEGSDLVCDSKPKRKSMRSQKKSSVKKQKGEVKTLHLSSCILASHSPFFFKLFKNGMKESTEREVTLKINASEEEAFMDLLKYMYNNTLSASTVSEVLKVLMVADKFEVTSCMRYCGKLVRGIPVSLESAIVCLELPPGVFMGKGGKALQKLRDEAEQYFASNFRDFTNSVERAMDLPLSALEVVLGIKGLQMVSEDSLFEFILEWGQAHYPNLKERREILTTRLALFIYFPYLTKSRLEYIQVCPDFDRKQVTKLVFDSLYANSGFPYGQRIHLPSATNLHFVDRVYEELPVKMEQFDSPQPHSFIYLYLAKKDYENLSVKRYLYSQYFEVGGRWFSLYALRIDDWLNKLRHFGLSVQMHQDSETCTLGYEFAVMGGVSNVFESIYKVESCTLKGGEYTGKDKLLILPLHNFASSYYFINEILHLRVELTIIDSDG